MARKIIRPLARPGLSLNGSPASARPQRAAVYVRVSSEEQLEGYSLDAQLRAARATCAERGWQIVAEYVEEGRSARYEDLSRRPRFKALMESADARTFDVVLVHKLDRFARNLLVLLETLGRLGRADVALESCSERLDYATPQGKLFMVLMGGIAQWYSDNLSQETKKGKRERKAQGLYNGLLPFGTMRDGSGVPTADTRAFCVLSWTDRAGRKVVDGGRETCNFEGLRLAFRLAAEGTPDSAIAQALTAAGYRTTGNRGQNPFHKDTVAEMVTNRFYWGELPVFEDVRTPEGKTAKVQVGWAPAKHGALEGFDETLWDRVMMAREQNRRGQSTTRADARTFSLTGLVTCHECEGRVGIMGGHNGKPRLRCRNRITKAKPCANSMTALEVYEEQIGAYLAAFQIPPDYQERLLAMVQAVEPDTADPERERRRIEARLDRIKELYDWGDYTRERYLGERAELQRQLSGLARAESPAGDLDVLATVLEDVRAAWDVADQPERNHLARVLFEDVRVLGDEVVGVKPRDAFAPFFRLNYELWKAENPTAYQQSGSLMDQKRKRRDSNPQEIHTKELPASHLPLVPGRCRPKHSSPVRGRYARPRSSIPPERWPEVREQAARCGLRATARAFGVSHEAVRQVVARTALRGPS